MGYILVQVQRQDGTVVCGRQGGQNTNVADIAIDSPGAGTWTYYLKAMRFADGTTQASTLYRRLLLAMVMKK